MTATRIARLRAALDEHGLDALLVSNPYNRRYLSGFTGTAGYLLISQSDAVIATDFRYWEQAGEQVRDFRLYKTVGALADWLPGLLEGLGGKRVGFEETHLTYAEYRAFTQIFGTLLTSARLQFVPAPPIVEELRTIKDAEEMALMEKAVALADDAFEHVAEHLEPGWTEMHVAREIESYIKDHGGEGTSFPSIVAGGARGAMPHARTGHEPLRRGEGVVIDMGALFDGYCSDMTRTIFLGKPTPEFKAVYDIVLTAQLTAEELVEPGMGGDYAHRIALKVIEEAGYGDKFGHGLGHGIGLEVHEPPRLALTSTSVLSEGQIFSIEPGIYLTGWGGVRIEDLVTLESGRCRVLNKASKIRFTGVAG